VIWNNLASLRTSAVRNPPVAIVGTITAADLYGDLEPAPRVRARDELRGVAVAAAATLAAAFLSDHYGAPLTLMGLLVGLALNFLSSDRRLAPGLALTSRTLLRWGIVLVGARVTLGDIVHLGPFTLLAVVAILSVTLASGVLTARLLGFSTAFGLLCGGSVAICGASAAMAFATLLGDRRDGQAQLALVLVGISAMSAAAMVLYPVLAHQLGFDDRQAGFLFGAAIHDVAQSLGAGYSFSPQAGQTAAIVKLTRVTLLAPTLAVVAMLMRTKDNDGKVPRLPWFIVGFFLLAAVNSAGFLPHVAADHAQQLATALLACAVTATGIRSPMQSLLGHGPKPLLVILAATLVALCLSLLAARFIVA
jgi:uncharacterized integral membrane protein (TIGR00698 family)